jgi:hypothetical protein
MLRRQSMSALTMRTPRWFGWVLLVARALDTILWGFVIVVIALFADEPWGDVAGDSSRCGCWVCSRRSPVSGYFEERQGQGWLIARSRPAQRCSTKARLKVRRRERWTPWKPCLSAMH